MINDVRTFPRLLSSIFSYTSIPSVFNVLSSPTDATFLIRVEHIFLPSFTAVVLVNPLTSLQEIVGTNLACFTSVPFWLSATLLPGWSVWKGYDDVTPSLPRLRPVKSP